MAIETAPQTVGTGAAANKASKPNRGRRWVGGGVVTAMALAAVGGYVLWPKQEARDGAPTPGPGATAGAGGGGEGAGAKVDPFVPTEALSNQGAVCRWMKGDPEFERLLGLAIRGQFDPASCVPQHTPGSDGGVLQAGGKRFVVVVNAPGSTGSTYDPSQDLDARPVPRLPGATAAHCEEDQTLWLRHANGGLTAISYETNEGQGQLPCNKGGLTPELGALAAYTATTVNSASRA